MIFDAVEFDMPNVLGSGCEIDGFAREQALPRFKQPSAEGLLHALGRRLIHQE
jgi:hypothetical protein